MSEGFGAFGKMPSVGDFFRVNAPAGFVTAWDRWVQTVMLETRQVLGEAWDDHYMSAPIWRFTLSAGQAGPQKVIGVMMPSVDRVGRTFPLTLMASLPTPGPTSLDHFCEGALFARLEDLALAALEDDMTRDRLEAELAGIAPPAFRGPAPVRELDGTLVITQAEAEGILPDLAAGLLARQYRQPSLWSAVLNNVPRLMLCQGLPSGNEALGLFKLDAPVWTEAVPI